MSSENKKWEKEKNLWKDPLAIISQFCLPSSKTSSVLRLCCVDAFCFASFHCTSIVNSAFWAVKFSHSNHYNFLLLLCRLWPQSAFALLSSPSLYFFFCHCKTLLTGFYVFFFFLWKSIWYTIYSFIQETFTEGHNGAWSWVQHQRSDMETGKRMSPPGVFSSKKGSLKTKRSNDKGHSGRCAVYYVWT